MQVRNLISIQPCKRFLLGLFTHRLEARPSTPHPLFNSRRRAIHKRPRGLPALVIFATALPFLAVQGGASSGGGPASSPPAARAQADPQAKAPEAKFRRAAKSVGGQYIVVLKDGSNLTQVVDDHKRKAHAGVLDVYGHAINGYAAKLSASGLAAVKADPRVDYVVQDREGSPLLGKPGPGPTGPGPQTVPTGVDRIDGDLSSQLSGDKTGAVAGPGVAIVDTGIDVTHPDLNVVGGVDCIKGFSGDDGTYNDGYGHGTHVAGIVGAKDDSIGVVGVAPGVPLYSVRVLNSQATGNGSTQLCGVDWVTANAAALGIRVANFSQASFFITRDDGNCGYTNNDPMHQAICRSTAAGVLWSVAAGNSQFDISTNYVDAPMGYDEVLTATAMADANGTPGGGGTITCRKGDVDDAYASFSDWVTSTADIAHTIAAPGVCINSTWKGGTYAVESGTSMAAPTVAGTVALCMASGACMHPGDPLLGTLATRFTPPEVIQKIRGDADAYNRANPTYGFTGDPLKPYSNSKTGGLRYYGFLLRAAGY
jgi:subtilisin family serine protease